jgi:hypothetical protein
VCGGWRASVYRSSAPRSSSISLSRRLSRYSTAPPKTSGAPHATYIGFEEILPQNAEDAAKHDHDDDIECPYFRHLSTILGCNIPNTCAGGTRQGGDAKPQSAPAFSQYQAQQVAVRVSLASVSGANPLCRYTQAERGRLRRPELTAYRPPKPRLNTRQLRSPGPPSRKFPSTSCIRPQVAPGQNTEELAGCNYEGRY